MPGFYDAADASTVSTLLAAISAANTAAATSGSGAWMDTQPVDGKIIVIMSLGALTGSLAGKMQVADDANGTNAVDVSGATFATGVANTAQRLVVYADGLAKRYLGFVGTIVTGPVLIGVAAIACPKYV